MTNIPPPISTLPDEVRQAVLACFSNQDFRGAKRVRDQWLEAQLSTSSALPFPRSFEQLMSN